jgi:hypothetical protein
VLKYNGSAWAPGADLSGGGGVGGSGSAGAVAYWSDASNITGNSNLVWDESNNLLGIGLTPKAGLHTGGSRAVVISEASGAYAVKDKDYLVIAGNTTTDVGLPDADQVIGRILVIRCTSTDGKGVRVLSVSGKDTIDGNSTVTLTNLDNGSIYCITLVAYKAGQWITINKAVK